jgi:hypothetical protein
MAVVLNASVFQNGKLLDPDALNEALYDTTFPATFGEHGVYSAPNGGLTQSNLSTDFKLRQEHVQPGQVVRSRAAGAWSTLDNMSDVTGRTTATDNVRIAKAQALPGCGVRVYCPFDAKAIRWNVSFFWYVSRWWGLDFDEDPYTDTAEDVTTHLFVDNQRKRGFRRMFPLTWFNQKAYSTTPRPNPYSLEAEQAAHWNISFLLTAAREADPTATLSPGWHEVYLGFYVRPVDETIVQDNIKKYDRSGPITAGTTVDIHQRWSVGCRSARVIAYR